jgi:dTMP kinase
MQNTVRQGKLFIFEGPDGVGKTTITQHLEAHLNQHVYTCDLISFPGRELGTLGNLIYSVHHEPLKYGVETVTSTSQQVLHIAAHLDAIERRILPLLNSGRHVILDRFWWSTWVYGRTSSISHDVLEKMIELERLCWGDVKPSIAFLLHRNAPLEREVDFTHWKQLSQEYDLLASKERDKYSTVKIENEGELEQTIQTIRLMIEQEIQN